MDKPYYEEDGVRYPRVTRIVSILRDPGLESWAQRLGAIQADKISSRKSGVGTKVHAMIQADLTGKKGKKPTTFEQKSAWQAYQRYKAERMDGVKIVGVEHTRVNKKDGYGCTPDVELERGVIEWKVTGILVDKNIIQVQANLGALPEKEEKVGRLVRLDSFTGEYQEVILPYDKRMYETFLKLKDVYVEWFGKEMEDGSDSA